MNMDELIEPHDPLPDCDCRACAIFARDVAVEMLAHWCVAVDENGAGWDDWDEHYKDAMYRPGPLRERLDKAILEAQNER